MLTFDTSINEYKYHIAISIEYMISYLIGTNVTFRLVVIAQRRRNKRDKAREMTVLVTVVHVGQCCFCHYERLSKWHIGLRWKHPCSPKWFPLWAQIYRFDVLSIICLFITSTIHKVWSDLNELTFIATEAVNEEYHSKHEKCVRGSHILSLERLPKAICWLAINYGLKNYISASQLLQPCAVRTRPCELKEYDL